MFTFRPYANKLSIVFSQNDLFKKDINYVTAIRVKDFVIKVYYPHY